MHVVCMINFKYNSIKKTVQHLQFSTISSCFSYQGATMTAWQFRWITELVLPHHIDTIFVISVYIQVVQMLMLDLCRLYPNMNRGFIFGFPLLPFLSKGQICVHGSAVQQVSQRFLTMLISFFSFQYIGLSQPAFLLGTAQGVSLKCH